MSVTMIRGAAALTRLTPAPANRAWPWMPSVVVDWQVYWRTQRGIRALRDIHGNWERLWDEDLETLLWHVEGMTQELDAYLHDRTRMGGGMRDRMQRQRDELGRVFNTMKREYETGGVDGHGGQLAPPLEPEICFRTPDVC